MKKVAVVILNWNGKKWLERFLPSVVKNTNANLAEIIIADNASTDDSISFLKSQYPELRCIVLDKNYGFTGGYNRALEQLNHEYFVLLNSDIEVTPNWLDHMLRMLEGDKQIAACQPKILSYNNKDFFEYAGAAGGYIDFLAYPFCRGRLLDTIERDKGQYDDAKKVFWASGACMFVRASVYKELGGLDEYFFAHMEEIDLCWRMQNAGYDIWVEPLSVVYHVGGGTLQSDHPRKTHFNFRNNLLMIAKNEVFWKAFLIIFIRLFLDGLAGIRFLFQGKFAHVGAIIKAHFGFYKNSFRYLSIRKNGRSIKTIYPKSLIWQYYVEEKKKYSLLKK